MESILAISLLVIIAFLEYLPLRKQVSSCSRMCPLFALALSSAKEISAEQAYRDAENCGMKDSFALFQEWNIVKIVPKWLQYRGMKARTAQPFHCCDVQRVPDKWSTIIGSFLVCFVKSFLEKPFRYKAIPANTISRMKQSWSRKNCSIMIASSSGMKATTAQHFQQTFASLKCISSAR